MAYTYVGFGQNKISKVKFYWNKASDNVAIPKYENVGTAVANRPNDSTILCVNVYGNVNGRNRKIGSGYFPIMSLLGASEANTPIHRIFNEDASGHMKIFGFKSNGWPAAHMGKPIVRMIYITNLGRFTHLFLF